jgi:hypothetical protein
MRSIALNLRIWLAAALLALAGCGHAIDTEVSGDLAAPLMRFTQGSDHQPCIREFGVTETATRATMWGIRSATGSCQRLDALRYGLTPEGYAPTTPARPLSPIGKYSLFIEGLGPDAPGGWCDFAWDGRRWTTQGSFCSGASGR